LRLIILTFILCSITLAQRHHIAVEFSEAVDWGTASDVNNYTVFDAGLNEIDVLNVWKANDSVYAVVVNFLDYKGNYSIRVENVKDLAGNWINENNSAWFDFDGFDINEQKPYLIIK